MHNGTGYKNDPWGCYFYDVIWIFRHYVKTLYNEEKIVCDSDIFIVEIIQSFEALKNNKSPGTDGLRPKFYKGFAQDLVPFLVETYLENIDSETLPPTLLQGLLKLRMKLF